ncbi:YggS family pyridoxal phosphate-dependent enzyme [Geobacillus sp. G4]|uniref:Pyridoxal phosphate homeostasis protein n=1 Tax=Geobacillus zalihae TaxID=213419 RepID=A0A1V9CT57_9BACL|nr:MULTISPECIES: YggS family pyridoxal phosphate-dependent enzyme [Geobacillus]AGE21606.1 pyridoxal phosphate-dependent enzyme [Geobacillus sp. GHH01]EPR27690.1 Pyridoxal-5'-phosphate family protein [Geobacillus sp. WSUCF1]OQP16992.1 YggS family pyridoxal phosphate enzyme [Geobacillus zalihae]OQP24718.1 YggS family pyridoxal phosphate enzyme [Geobacillus zalihae]QNU18369.1 YggS family pyridoxal phosphate-dependent enzyme [Geobacillus zalihae]
MTVRDNLAAIRREIEAACARVGRDPAGVRIVAVTKYVDAERAMEVLDAGIADLGENRSDQLIEKHARIGNQATWHFIGTLQSRKVKDIIDKVDYIHSLDRLSLAKEIEKRAVRPVKCFVQVNVSGEVTKHGLAPEETIPFIEQLRAFSRIEVVGLMTMAPHTDDEAVLRACFRQLRMLKERVQALGMAHAPCTELSMGMSNDYTIAIEEGATFVRIGSALVGSL